jgi:alkylation response protein AidB-like acyl-CoA dehydrogenase
MDYMFISIKLVDPRDHYTRFTYRQGWHFLSHSNQRSGEGLKLLLQNFNRERLALSVVAIRCARVCYQEAFQYALKRKTFGKRLIDHDVHQGKFADMPRAIESS